MPKRGEGNEWFAMAINSILDFCGLTLDEVTSSQNPNDFIVRIKMVYSFAFCVKLEPYNLFCSLHDLIKVL